MAGHAREDDAWDEPIHSNGVGMADAAGFDAQANLACGRINQRTLNEVQSSRRRDMNRTISGHGGRFLSGFLSVACAIDRINLHWPAFENTGERPVSYTENDLVWPDV